MREVGRSQSTDNQDVLLWSRFYQWRRWKLLYCVTVSVKLFRHHRSWEAVDLCVNKWWAKRKIFHVTRGRMFYVIKSKWRRDSGYRVLSSLLTYGETTNQLIESICPSTELIKSTWRRDVSPPTPPIQVKELVIKGVFGFSNVLPLDIWEVY